jgi:transposase
MSNRHFHLTTDAAAALQAAEQHAPNGATRTRMQAVRLYGLDYTVADIHIITGLSRSRLLQCCAAYVQDGIAALHDHRAGGNCHTLTPAQVAEVGDKLRQYTPRSLFGSEAATAGDGWTFPDLRRAIQHWYGVTYQSDTSYRSRFRRCGFSYQRPARVFRSRRPQAMLDFDDQIEKN